MSDTTPSAKPTPVNLPIDIDVKSVRLDAGTNLRPISPSIVEDYAAAMIAETLFPPIVVFDDGENRWLADGFHRVAAAVRIAKKTISAVVKDGTKRDAILHACGANDTHGLRRTSDDKRRAVDTLLKDAEWMTLSSHKIAELCHVSHPFVEKVRESVGNVSNRL